jgi:hypothetical protein
MVHVSSDEVGYPNLTQNPTFKIFIVAKREKPEKPENPRVTQW